MRWDIFCKVIDNHGDAGVCWRLASELARRGELVRLWIDEPAMLAWMAPGQPGVEVVHWTAQVPPHAPGDVVVEAFGCDPPPDFVGRMRAAPRPPAWINLEYLSAESYVERSHGLPSPVHSGPGAGLVKHFFYPGFTPRTGGLLREQDLPQRRAHFDRGAWLQPLGIRPGAARVVSLFCYEPASLPELLVTAGRAAGAMRAALARLAAEHAGWNAQGLLRPHWLPLLSQREYDHLLWSCDLNFVRGEDSLVRGLLAGVPCVWQIYPQDDFAHHAKLEAFLRWLQPPADLARFHRAWNGLEGGLPAPEPAAWQAHARETFTRIQDLPELGVELRRFAAGRGRI